MICREAVGRAGIPACSTPQSILQTLPSCCVHSRIYSGYHKGFSTGEKLKLNESKVQTVTTVKTEPEGQGNSPVRTQGEKTLPYAKSEWERSSGLSKMLNFALCPSLLEILDYVRKLPAIYVKGLSRVHKEKRSLRQILNTP